MVRDQRVLKDFSEPVRGILGGIMWELLDEFPQLTLAPIPVEDKHGDWSGFRLRFGRSFLCDITMDGVRVCMVYHVLSRWRGGGNCSANLDDALAFDNWLEICVVTIRQYFKEAGVAE